MLGQHALDTMPTEREHFESRARALHEWYCQSTGQVIPLRMDLLVRWVDWFAWGHSGPELAAVIRYLRHQVSQGKRNPGSLKLSSLLDVTKFEEDLGLAQMARSGKLDPEARLAPLPEAEAPQRRRTPQSPPREMPAAPKEHSQDVVARRLAELDALKRDLS